MATWQRGNVATPVCNQESGWCKHRVRCTLVALFLLKRVAGGGLAGIVRTGFSFGTVPLIANTLIRTRRYLSNMSQVNLQVLSLIFSPEFKPVKLYDNVLESKKDIIKEFKDKTIIYMFL